MRVFQFLVAAAICGSLARPSVRADEPVLSRVAVQSEIEWLDGRVFVDKDAPGEPVFKVRIGKCHRGANDAVVAKLTVFPELRELHLQSCREMTNDGLESLQNLPNLKVVYINCSKIDDEGLKHLESVPKLQTLYLRMCGHITQKGLASLKRKLPHCEVILGPPGSQSKQYQRVRPDGLPVNPAN